MSFRIVIHSRARRDIVQRTQAIAADNAAAAQRWYKGVLTAIASLKNNPERCEVAYETQYLPITLRHLLYGKRTNKFRILFSIRNTTIHVWTVRHAARDWLQFDDLLGEGG